VKISICKTMLLKRYAAACLHAVLTNLSYVQSAQHSTICKLPCVCCPAGAEELQKRLALMQKEQKLIQEEAQAAVLEAAAAAPAVMAGAHVGHADGAAAAAGKERVLEVRPYGTMQCVAAACFEVIFLAATLMVWCAVLHPAAL
jgi:hypothetical protein